LPPTGAASDDNHHAVAVLVIPANLLKETLPWRVPTPKRVYLGKRMPDGEKEEIIEICKKKGIEAQQMHLADDSFCLRSELIVAVKP
jgi:hypothetical protein